ncbi:hypothetical protein ACQP1U_14435 [Actinomycetota bacterium]
MTNLTSTTAVADYVRAVRTALGDLPAEEVEDLTLGMEADLVEIEAEGGGDLASRLGTPEAYAAELRSAAGLPAPAAQRSWWVRQRVEWGERWSRSQTRWPWLEQLRPVWWVLRGLVATLAVTALFGLGILGPAILLALFFAAVSFALGVRSAALPSWARGLVAAGNVLAAVLALPLLLWGLGRVAHVPSYGPEPAPYAQQGLAMDGNPVTNVYVYDADGKRLSNVRLFDQGGRSLNANQQWEYLTDANGTELPRARGPLDSQGQQWSNVFPFPYAQGTGPWDVPPPEAGLESWSPPMTLAPLVLSDAAKADPNAVPSASPSSSPTAATSSTSGPTASSPTSPTAAPSTTATTPSASTTSGSTSP